MYKIIRTYENNHPNIQIKWVDVPFSEGEKRTLAAVMTDNPPDLINLKPTSLNSFESFLPKIY